MFVSEADESVLFILILFSYYYASMEKQKKANSKLNLEKSINNLYV